MPTEAGNGEHHIYRIRIESSDQIPLKPNEHYLGVDAVAWFMNKQSSWFNDRIASGTLDIKIQGGVESYQAALGTFDLKGGSHYAPVFDRPVLQDRNYRGGPITLGASLSAIRKDTVVAGLLKSAANASLGVAAGMVQTATAAGPIHLIGAAGDELVKGVKTVLSQTGEKREPIFDFQGLEKSFTPDTILGRETYVLFHRGAALPENSLRIHPTGELSLPYVNDALLEDGAWLLLRLRRCSAYSGQRDWFDAARKLRAGLQDLITDVQSENVTPQQALDRLKPSATGNQTLYDEYARLRTIIRNDGVLTENEATLFAGQLTLALNTAKKAIENGTPDLLNGTLFEVKRALQSRKEPTVDVQALFIQERTALAHERSLATARRRVSKGNDDEGIEVLATEKARSPTTSSSGVTINGDMEKSIEESFAT